jgi:hypothetical protein
MTAYANTWPNPPLYRVVHVFDPSYGRDPDRCVCGLLRQAEVHAKPAVRRAT